MPSIVPPLPARPTTPTVTAQYWGNNQPVSASTIIYSTTWFPHDLVLGVTINYGTIWFNITQTSTTSTLGRLSENHGTVVVESDGYHAHSRGSRGGDFYNTGTYQVYSTQGEAIVAADSDMSLIRNSGLIAAYAPAHTGRIYHFSNGGTVINEAGGRILVEAADAVALWFTRQMTAPGQQVQVMNAGVIEARTTSDIASIAIVMGGHDGTVSTVVNSGIIRADYAFYDHADWGYILSVQNATQLIQNLSGGLIEGRSNLGRGNDVIENAGIIRGDIQMREGEDRVDNRNGTIEGFIDFSWGNDELLGGTGAEFAGGGNGNDRLYGNGGNDLLLGGGNDDLLVGGAGNDGLFGEYGNDRIVTEAGDYVSGGAGHDRIELGDYGFEHIDGGSGIDTLVLPSDARLFDLSAALAEGAFTGIEIVDLGQSGRIVIRAPDIRTITDGSSELRVDGGESGTVVLVGDWVDGGQVVVDGASYRRYISGSETVLVRNAPVTISATAPSEALGLDPFSGERAPVPGEATGVSFTSLEFVLANYQMSTDIFINPEETWGNDWGGLVIESDRSQFDLINHGALVSISDDAGSSGARVVYGRNLPLLENYGDIIAQWRPTNQGGGTGNTYALAHIGRVENYGRIIADAPSGQVRAMSQIGGSVLNRGEVIAINDYHTAIAIHGAITLVNDGLIRATGGEAAFGIFMALYGREFTNSGTIEAISTRPGSLSTAIYATNDAQASEFVNSGRISGDLAIHVIGTYNLTSSLSIRNLAGGVVSGNVLLVNTVDTLVNSGRIVGDVRLGTHGDIYDGSQGQIVGTVYGEEGDDRLTGGDAFDRLDGGAGDDVLDGGLGADHLIGGAGNDTFHVDRQDDLVFEDAGGGTDTVISTGSFYLYANVENLTLAGSGDSFGVGNELANTILGNGGSNLLIAGAGDDTVRGGGGVDSLFGQDGNDQLFGDAGIDYLVGGIGTDTLDGGDDADALYGEDGDDILIGGSGFHTDILVGGAGNDVLRGDSGLGDYDLMDGGAGNDSYYVDTPDDLTFEAANGGTDTVYATINGAGYYLYANVENLVLGGDTPFGVGNELNNRITGSAASNWLLGGAGDDTLNGRGGNDVLFGEAGADIFVFERGTGGDVIGDFVAGTDRIDLSAFGFTSFAQVQAVLGEQGGTAFLTLGNGDMVVLNGVARAALSAGDFILASAGDSKVPVMEPIDVDPRPDLIHDFVNPRLFVDVM